MVYKKIVYFPIINRYLPKYLDISELLLCRQKPIELEMSLSQSAFTQLPVCIPTQSIQLYVGAGFQCEFDGRFTTVHRGVVSVVISFHSFINPF